MEYKTKNKISNVKYVDRDFIALKNSLINFAKQYFPNTYRDFNETSPGMMLIEMSAYVGDVLNFYIDHQYQEMMLPLAEEKRNIINLARTFGYKNKAIIPAFCKLTLTQEVDADLSDATNPKPNYGQTVVLDKGMKVSSTTNPDIIFESLDVVDFTISGSQDRFPEVSRVDNTTGLAQKFIITRQVQAVSGETKQFTFTVGPPKKYRKLTLPEKDVVEIISCVDENGAPWYEVDYLAQDKVPKEQHYSQDINRTSGYVDQNGNNIPTPVPYTLDYINAPKRFITEVNEMGFTSLVFGNGVLRNGQRVDSTFKGVEQIGITLPGQTENLSKAINPLLGDSYATLGEAPTQTKLIVKYRVGGGIKANVPSTDLSTIDEVTTIPAGSDTSNILVENREGASGGADEETVDEIRQRVMQTYTTQNRCVTKEDYEARVMAMPARFGNIAKVYVTRAGTIRHATNIGDITSNVKDLIGGVIQAYNTTVANGGDANSIDLSGVNFDLNADGTINTSDITQIQNLIDEAGSNVSERDSIPTIEIFTLSYNNEKQLIPTPFIIQQNIKRYLSQYRLLTEQVTIRDGYVINFGIYFDVVANRSANKSEVKLQCINTIIEHFKIDNRYFKEVINIGDIEYKLQGIPGVRSVNHITMTQDFDWTRDPLGNQQPVFKTPLYDRVIDSNGKEVRVRDNGFNYFYKFQDFYEPNSVAGRGIILPSYDPSVFELRNPRQNVKGVVR
tara:strand:+ start:1440 stop:3629 length:2190 start_codon:yes stop_codon:yes gene_type:complete